MIEHLVLSLKKRGLHSILITGGEPLLREDLFEVCARITRHGLKLVLSTNGLLLEKFGEEVTNHFGIVIVSLDAHDPEVYRDIRGCDEFSRVIDGITLLKKRGGYVILAHTLQKNNIRWLPEFIEFSKRLGVDKISVRPVDAYSSAFARKEPQMDLVERLIPSEDEIEQYSRTIRIVEKKRAPEIQTGFLKPNLNGFKMIGDYFLACRGRGNFPPRECAALFISLAVEANGDIRPCFFLPPFANINGLTTKDMKDIIQSEDLVKARRMYKEGDIGECRRCVQPYSADL